MAEANLRSMSVDRVPVAALRHAMLELEGPLDSLERLMAEGRGRADSVAASQQENANGKGKGRAMDAEVMEGMSSRMGSSMRQEEQQQEHHERPTFDAENGEEEAGLDVDVPQTGGQKKKLKSKKKKRSKQRQGLREEMKLNRELFDEE